MRGCGAVEALGLRMCDVDLSRNTLTVAGHRAKLRQTRHVPLNAVLVVTMRDYIKQHRRSDLPDARLFGVQSIRRSWSRLNKQADWVHGCNPACVASFVRISPRHECAYIAPCSRCLGTTVTLTERYLHLAPEHERAAIDRLPVLMVQRREDQDGVTCDESVGQDPYAPQIFVKTS